VVEQDAVGCKETVSVTIVLHDIIGIDLGRGIGAAGLK